MEALEAILTRRCVRNFAPTRIPPEELLEKVAEAGTFAPSGMGRQAGLIVKLYNREYRDRFAALNAQIMGREDDPFYGARHSYSSYLPINDKLPISTMELW